MIAWELQKSIYTRLTTDATLMAAIKGVHDEVPQILKEEKIPNDKYFPFVVIGDDTLRDWGTDTTVGFELTTNLHIWTNHKGKKQQKIIASHLHRLLHRHTLAVSGHNSVHGQFQNFQIILDSDGLTRHGIFEVKYFSMVN